MAQSLPGIIILPDMIHRVSLASASSLRFVFFIQCNASQGRVAILLSCIEFISYVDLYTGALILAIVGNIGCI